MKFLVLFSILFSLSAFASISNSWNTIESQKFYKTTKTINLDLNNKSLSIPEGTSFELIEKTKLNMIKVYLYKYKIPNCRFSDQESDLSLVSAKQPNGKEASVGVNLSKGCNVEIFVDFDDYETASFLQ